MPVRLGLQGLLCFFLSPAIVLTICVFDFSQWALLLWNLAHLVALQLHVSGFKEIYDFVSYESSPHPLLVFTFNLPYPK